MLVTKGNMTINLQRFDFIRVLGVHVEAVRGNPAITIVRFAKCESEKEAKELVQAVTKAWANQQSHFDVDLWIAYRPQKTA